MPAKEFPYSVVSGGVHDANEAQQATDDQVVKLHYAGIDTKRLEATSYKTNTFRYVSYRVSDKIFWTAKPVTIKAGETVLCDGKNFIRARCGNRISEHPMQPTRQNEPSEEELDTTIPADSGSSIEPPSLTSMFTADLLDAALLLAQPMEQATSPTTAGLGSSPGGYSISPLTESAGGPPAVPGVLPAGSPVVPGAVTVGPVIPPGSVVASPVVLPVVPSVVLPGSVVPPGLPVAPAGPPVVSPVVEPGGPPIELPTEPPTEPPIGPPTGPPIGPLIGPTIGPLIDQPIGPLIEPLTDPPPSLTTPEPDSLALFGSMLVLGIAITRIKVRRAGRRKR